MASAAAVQPDLPFALVEEILLRLDDAADLIRASAACASFRRLISDGCFLCRFRSLHRLPILGILTGTYQCYGGISFYPARPPHISVPAARALARAADFSFTSLPGPTHYWRIRDVRDGRVLLSKRGASAIVNLFVSESLVVYDPLHRHHVQIPPIPHDLLAAMGHADKWHEFDPFLIPAAAGGKDDLSFQVMCNVLFEHKVEAVLYSSVTEEWRGVASSSITSYKCIQFPCLVERSYARGCFYWVDYIETVMLVLDMREMKFSLIDLPAGSKHRHKAIVEVMEDRIGLLIVGENMLDLYSKTLPGIGAKDWRHDHTIRLSDDYEWSLTGGAVEGYGFLFGTPRYELEVWENSQEDKKEEPPSAHCFTVEFETLQVQELCVLKFDAHPHFLYASLPPPFATPSL
ncbi:unnamed protein product [Urochloa decumbens]|uniref:F-box protein AT5G49610-like beta-propeller domain-containing protein n=1 Tax=Urochloa decumbens TaxID=240449 RepID=A0ABC8WC88_9POAL